MEQFESEVAHLVAEITNVERSGKSEGRVMNCLMSPRRGEDG
jgi:translation initiation factor IF-3